MKGREEIELFLENSSQYSKTIDLALQDQNIRQFELRFKNCIDLAYAAHKCPDQAKSIIHFIIKHRDEFDRLITTKDELIYLAKELPNCADDIMQFILARPTEFQRLIKTTDDLKQVGKQFPHYASLFNQPSVADVMKSLTDCIAEIQQAASLLSLGKRMEDSVLYPLPDEILIKIVSHLTNQDIFTLETAAKIADAQIGRPLIRNKE